MSLTRRELLQRASALGLLASVPVLTRCAPTTSETPGGDGLPVYIYEGPPGPETLFSDGVASGDPLADAVILWTALDAASLTESVVDVFVEVATDSAFQNRVSAGWYATSAERGHCLKLDATGLAPDTTYFYRFQALGRMSPIGRTKTLPTGSVSHVRLGVCACSNYAYGFFHAYWHLSQRRDLDAILHLGDYIYEYESGDYGSLRPCDPPHEIVTLEDYRTRYRQYRRDPNLQEAHRQHPFITLWDDHEFANNPEIGGAQNHQPETEGDWETRVANAIQAYDEWMPTRVADPGVLYRSFSFGDLLALHMVDIKRPLIAPVEGEALTMLGETQAQWLDEQISETRASWMVLGQQQTFASAQGAWDSHVPSRLRIRDAAADAGIRNVVVLTGDIHQARCADLSEDPAAYDPATGGDSWGVELVCSSITSPGRNSDLTDRPHIHWTTGDLRGYLVLDLRPDRAQGDWFGFPDLAKYIDVLPVESWERGWLTREGENHLEEATSPASEKAEPAPLAPPS